MKAPPPKVQVFSIAPPRAGMTKAQRRWYVKWRVQGRDRTRSFKTRAEADRFRSSLQVAVHEGQRFEVETGLPATWAAPSTGPTWWSWSREWLSLKWPGWSGHSRRSAVESLALLTPLMVSPHAARPPVGLAEWLRVAGYRMDAAPASGRELAWLDRWSIPLSEIGPALLESTLRQVCLRADGASVVPAVARRRRNTLGAVLRSAVRRDLLAANPMERVEHRAQRTTAAIDVSTVPSPLDVATIVEAVAALPSDGARYASLFATVGIAGMRPSEAIGLEASDLALPHRGWGLAALRGAVTAPGTRYTTGGLVIERKALKQRAVGVVREVPLAPPLVARLRAHLDRWPAIDGRVFSNTAGRPVTPTNYGPVWVRARAAVWPAGHALASVTVYDLRHAAATMMLRAGVPPAEVARRLGHSVDVLMRVYAGVFEDERDRSNELIDQVLAGPGAQRERQVTLPPGHTQGNL